MQTLFTQYKYKTEGLSHLTAQIAQREQLLITLRACLAPSMQQALLGAEVIDDTLLLTTPSAAWATRLRFEAQKLLIAAHNPSLRHYHIQVITQANDIVERKVAHWAEKPSEEALAALQTLTNDLDAKDELKASMERLLRVVKHAS